MLRPVHGTTSVHHSFRSDFGVGALEGCASPLETRSLLLQHRYLVLQLCRNLGIVVNWEKSDLHHSTHVQYLGMLIDTSLEKVFPSEARLSYFREVATSFLALPSPPAHMWQQLLGHMALLEWFLLRGRSRMCLLQWCLKYH